MRHRTALIYLFNVEQFLLQCFLEGEILWTAVDRCEEWDDPL